MNGPLNIAGIKPQPGEIWKDNFGVGYCIVACGNKYANCTRVGTRITGLVHLRNLTRVVAEETVIEDASPVHPTTRPSSDALDREFLEVE